MDIKEVSNEIKGYMKEIKREEDLKKKIEEIKGKLERGESYDFEKYGVIIENVKEAEQIIENIEKAKEEYEDKIRDLRMWISYDKAYLLGYIIGEELWNKYGDKSIDILIERISKYNDIENILDKDVIEKVKNKFNSYFS
ncbi:hypothetical protein YN1_8470 [Nanoarchaeota archaeon]